MTFEEVRDLVMRIDPDPSPVPAIEAADMVQLRRLADDPDVGIAMGARPWGRHVCWRGD